MIRNVVFDIGNVFVRWSPAEVISRCFNLELDSDETRKRATALLRSPLWIRYNLGELTLADMESAYQSEHGLSRDEAARLLFHTMDHQDLIDGTEAIARRLKSSGYRLFALTDNVREIVAHLKERYQFWELFVLGPFVANLGVVFDRLEKLEV